MAKPVSTGLAFAQLQMPETRRPIEGRGRPIAHRAFEELQDALFRDANSSASLSQSVTAQTAIGDRRIDRALGNIQSVRDFFDRVHDVTDATAIALARLLPVHPAVLRIDPFPQLLCPCQNLAWVAFGERPELVHPDAA
jgi:hypothetical protein